MAQLTISNLSVRFAAPGGEVRALQEVSLCVEEGEILTLVGPSGAGKSTLLRAIAGLEDLASGEIRLGREAIHNWPPERREVAMVFQNPALFPHLTVYENMALPLKLRRRPSAEIARQVRAASDLLGITGLSERMPGTLSGGERQRVAIGRAMVRKPKVFLFDEPLSDLDVRLRHQVRIELLNLRRHLRATFLYVTHDQSEALSMGHRVAVLNEGALVQVADPRSLYREPRNTFVASFLGEPAINLLPARGAGPNREIAVDFGAGVFARGHFDRSDRSIISEGRLIAGIRPESVLIQTSPLSRNEPEALRAQIEQIEFLGHETRLLIVIGATHIWSRSSPTVSLRAGDQVEVRVDWDQVLLFDAETGEAVAAPLQSG